MEYEDLRDRKVDPAKKPSLPPGFTFDPENKRFITCQNPHDEHPNRKPRFEIIEYRGCLPVFESKVAGTTLEGRPFVFQELKGKSTKMKADVMVCLKRDKANPFDSNAIKVFGYVQDNDGNEIMAPKMIGFLPKEVAAFVRYVAHYRIGYRVKMDRFSAHKAFPSMTLILTPFPVDDTSSHLMRDMSEEVVAAPAVKKVVSGKTVEEFREALIKQMRRK